MGKTGGRRLTKLLVMMGLNQGLILRSFLFALVLDELTLPIQGELSCLCYLQMT